MSDAPPGTPASTRPRTRTSSRTSTQAWQDALAAFERWQDAPDPAALLAAIEAQDPALAARVRGLIEADRQAEAGDFLAQPVQAEVLGQELAGQRLGAWTLQSLLGRGGMGEVWRARRSDGAHSGEAAIKLLHSPGRGDAAAARFRREGELLARLRHPHIAQLLDIGEAQLGPWALRYLVIELVDGGERLDAFATARQLDVAQRLALMQQVCSAVAHAHAQLIVHRDLKPGNVLVTPEGQVKLLDFGVAKLLDSTEGADELTRLAAAGLTPEYAAPEQLRGEPVSVATDVYALGVMLCQLLTGQRQLAPATTIDADLRALIHRATQARPEDRYASVAALSEDLRRYQCHEPLLARAGPWRYRAGKFLRRHRVAVASSSLVTLSLLAGLAGTWWQWREAAQEARRTQRVQTVMTELLGAFGPEVANRADVPMTQLLRRAWEEAQSRLAGEPDLLGDVAKPLGLLLVQAGDMQRAVQALSVAQARAQGDAELSIQLASALRRVGRPDDARQLLEGLVRSNAGAPGILAHIELGVMALEANETDRARALLARAESSASARFGRTHEVYRRACDALADLARATGQWDEARRWLHAVVEASPDAGTHAALARMSEATFEAELGRFAEAIPLLRATAQALTQALGPDDVNTLYTRAWLAQALFHHGQADAAIAEAASAAQRALRSSEPDAAPRIELVLSQLEVRSRRKTDTPPDLPERLASAGAPDAADRARLLHAEALLRQGRTAAADAQITALGALERLEPNDRWQALALQGLCRFAQGQPEAAGVLFERARVAAELAVPAGHPDRLRAKLLARQLQDTAPDGAPGPASDIAQLAAPRADATQVRGRLMGLLSNRAPRSIEFGLTLLGL